MSKLPAQSYDWSAIQRLIEQGKTAYEIAKLPEMPTKQAIAYRIKKDGWRQIVGNEVLSTANALKATEGVLERVLTNLRSGLTLELACAQEGITDRHLRQLRQENPELEEAVSKARADKVARRVRALETAGERDWKAHAWLLERDPDSREILRTRETVKEGAGPTIVLNVNRGEVTVSDDGRTIDVTPNA